MITRLDFVQDDAAAGAEWRDVVGLADELVVHLEEATRLGFRDESKGLFETYQSSALRPDYFRPIGSTGVILEVERGKTTINNMDLLDFWKCHICEHASYLFLMAPPGAPAEQDHDP